MVKVDGSDVGSTDQGLTDYLRRIEQRRAMLLHNAKAAVDAQRRGWQRIQAAQQKKLACERSAKSYAGFCRWKAGSARADDYKACGSWLSGASGSISLTADTFELTGGVSAEVYLSQCNLIANSTYDAARQACQLGEDYGLSLCE